PPRSGTDAARSADVRRGSVDQAARAQVGQDLLRGLLDALLRGVHADLGARRGLVRVGDAGEVLDDPLAGLLVETLGVALLDDLERAVDEDLDERGLAARADLVADRRVRRDRRGDRDDAVARQHVRDVADAADVGVAVLLG